MQYILFDDCFTTGVVLTAEELAEYLANCWKQNKSLPNDLRIEHAEAADATN
jgi:hypothetical protein